MSALGVRIAYRRTGVVIPWDRVTGFAARRNLSLAGAFGLGRELFVNRTDGSRVPTTASLPRSPFYFGQKRYGRALQDLEEGLRLHRERATNLE